MQENIGKSLITLAVLVLAGLLSVGFVTLILYREIMPNVLTWYTCAFFGIVVIGVWYATIRYLVILWKTRLS